MPDLRETLIERRAQCASMLGDKALVVVSGRPRLRNLTAATYPYRASSEFLYLFGVSLPGAIGIISKSQQSLILENPPEGDEIWHGPSKSCSEIAATIGLDDVIYRSERQDWFSGISTDSIVALPCLDIVTNRELEGILDRGLDIFGKDRLAIDVMVDLRLCADAFGLDEMRKAIAITCSAFKRAHEVLEPGIDELEVRAELEAVCTRAGVSSAFPSIVTREGDILHHTKSGGALASDDMLLVDFGAESPFGYASDVTRTWSVGGEFTTLQQELYALVLEVQQTAIRLIAPKVEFAEVHMVAAQLLAKGLVSLGLLRGSVDDIVAAGAHALFFPHGLGHLIGLDAHDMELFGDSSGYKQGRVRSDEFGISALRLDRPLEPGMVVTIEPGIYNIASLQQPNEAFREAQQFLPEGLDERLEEIRGIRIEDMVLVTEEGHEVLTEMIPK